MVQKQSKGIVLLLLCIFVLPLAAAQIADDPETWDADFVQANPDAAYQTNPDRAIELYPEILYQPLIAQDYFTNNPETVLQYPEPAKEYFSSPENAIKSKGTLEAYGLLIGEFPEEVIAHPDVFGHAIGKDISIANQNKGAINLFAKEKWGIIFKRIKGELKKYDGKEEQFTTKGAASTEFALKDFKKFYDVTLNADGSVSFTNINPQEEIVYTLRNALAIEDDIINNIKITRGSVSSGRNTISIPKNCFGGCSIVIIPRKQLSDEKPMYAESIVVSGKNMQLPHEKILEDGTIRYDLQKGKISWETYLDAIYPHTTYYDEKIGRIRTTDNYFDGYYNPNSKSLNIFTTKSPLFVELSPSSEVSSVGVSGEGPVSIKTLQSEVEIVNHEIFLQGGPPEISIVAAADFERHVPGYLITGEEVRYCYDPETCRSFMEFPHAIQVIREEEKREKTPGLSFTFAKDPSSKKVAEFIDYLQTLPPNLRKSLNTVNFKEVIDQCGSPSVLGCAYSSTKEIDVLQQHLEKSEPLDSSDFFTGVIFEHEAGHIYTYRLNERENAENTLRKLNGIEAFPTFEDKWLAVAGNVYGETVLKLPVGHVWKNPTAAESLPDPLQPEGPRYGCVRPYGCTNFREDISTYLEEDGILNPAHWKEVADPDNPKYEPRYEQKAELLCTYGFLTQENCAKINGYIQEAKEE